MLLKRKMKNGDSMPSFVTNPKGAVQKAMAERWLKERNIIMLPEIEVSAPKFTDNDKELYEAGFNYDNTKDPVVNALYEYRGTPRQSAMFKQGKEDKNLYKASKEEKASHIKNYFKNRYIMDSFYLENNPELKSVNSYDSVEVVNFLKNLRNK